MPKKERRIIMAVLTMQNRKGGVAKTTSVVHLATVPALAGKKVLAIDMDPQGNTSQVFMAMREGEKDISDLLFFDAKIEDIIVHSKYGVDVLPNNKKIQRPDKFFYQSGRKDKDLLLLRNAIESVRNDYDLIIIDNNPSADTFSDMSLIAADYVLIPVDSANFSYDGIQDELQDFYNIKENFNDDIELLGVLLAHIKPQTKLLRTQHDAYDKIFDSLLLKAVIRDDNQIAEALARYMPVYFYNKKTNAGADYIEVAKQIGIISLDEYTELSRSYIGKKNRFLPSFMQKEE